MSGSGAQSELLAVWLRGLPLHEYGAFTDLAVALSLAKEKATSLPPSIDRRCAALINTKLDEAEHWMLSALRAAVDRSDAQRDVAPEVRCSGCHMMVRPEEHTCRGRDGA